MTYERATILLSVILVIMVMGNHISKVEPISTYEQGGAFTKQESKVVESEYKYLDEFTITYYCKCKKCCGKWWNSPTKSGTTPKENRTIAVDENIIPLGSKVLINGIEYTAEDTGSAIKGNRIDVYMDSHEECLKNGVNELKVFIRIER